MKTLFEELVVHMHSKAITYCQTSNSRISPNYEIGIEGQRRRCHLKEHHRVLYCNTPFIHILRNKSVDSGSVLSVSG